MASVLSVNTTESVTTIARGFLEHSHYLSHLIYLQGFFYCFPNGISIFKWLETDLKSLDTKNTYDHLVTENTCT